MGETTKIEWCDSTWNPWIGCTRVSPACDDCYAARSTPARSMGIAWGPGQPRHRTAAATWRQPQRWNDEHAEFFAQHGRRRRVFCASLADVFDNEVPEAWRDELMGLITSTPNLDWLLLTKRIGNVSKMLKAEAWQHLLHVWLGATVVNQAEADRDIPKLLAVPARVRFLSIEPMLGPIDLEQARWNGHRFGALIGWGKRHETINWVIAGGESGPKARPSHPDWFRSLRDQCAAAGVPFLFKQCGEWAEHDAGPPPHALLSMDTETGRATASACDGFISLAGEFVHDMDDATTDEPYRGMQRIGKKAAGRLLDGVEHDQFPEVPR